MGIICLYVLIQKSGQKTAKSHLCCNVWMVISNLMICLVPYQKTKVRATQCDRLVGSKMAAIG